MITNSVDKDNMGLVYISEKTTPDDMEIKNMQVIDKAGVFYVQFDSCLHSFDVMNRNNRMYEASNVMECLDTERIKHYLSHGGWFGEANHPIPEYKDMPLSPERIQDIDPHNTSHKMLNPHLENNCLVSNIQTDAGTDAGMNLAKKMVQGLIPGFSCRAIARLVLKGNKPVVNVKKIITYDWVLYQSHREAEQLKNSPNKFVNKTVDIIKEATDDLYGDTIIPLSEVLESVGRDSNIEYIMEAFELDNNDIIGYSPKQKSVILSDNTNTIYCNINMDTYRKVNDFMRSL